MQYLFFPQVYIAWYILRGFAYSSIPVNFRAVSMTFLSFLSQQTDPGEFLRPEAILSRSYLTKGSI